MTLPAFSSFSFLKKTPRAGGDPPFENERCTPPQHTTRLGRGRGADPRSFSPCPPCRGPPIPDSLGPRGSLTPLGDGLGPLGPCPSPARRDSWGRPSPRRGPARGDLRPPSEGRPAPGLSALRSALRSLTPRPAPRAQPPLATQNKVLPPYNRTPSRQVSSPKTTRRTISKPSFASPRTLQRLYRTSRCPILKFFKFHGPI